MSVSRFAAFAAVLFLSQAGAAVPALAQAAPAVSPPSFEVLAEKLLPTVVNVSTTTKLPASVQQQLPQLPQLPPGSPFEQFFKDFYDQYGKALPGPGNPDMNPDGGNSDKVSALGSGFIIDAANGYIVTNNHVIKDADEIKVILHDDTSLDATLVGKDDKTDLAVLKVQLPKSANGEAFKPAVWGDSDQAKVGSWVLAIGNPFGLGGTVTAGIVSARQRNINAGPYDDFIQTDASINRGNSGGPMFNTAGEVIGVNTAIFSPSGGSVGIGFAVPANLAKSVVGQLIKYGKTKRGWLGVRIQEVTADIAEGLKLDRARGALVSSVTAKSPSEVAGIVAGDVILSFDGKPINQMRQLPRIVADTEVGKKSTVVIWRKGAEKTVTVDLGQLEKAEENEQAASGADKAPAVKPPSATTEIKPLGLSVMPVDDAARNTYGLAKSLNGLVITDVKRGGAAADKGITAGDVIIEIDQQEVSTPADVIARLESAERAGKSSVLLFIARKEDRRFVALKPRKN